MKILHLEYAGGAGGIEKLCKDIGINSKQDENIFAFVHDGGVIYEEMQRENLNIIMLGCGRKDIIKLCNQITYIAKKHNVDIIIVHHPAPLIWIAIQLYMLKKNRAKVVVYAHSIYLEIVKKQKKRKLIYDRLLKQCDAIIAISQYVKNTFIDANRLNESKITVIYNGVVQADYDVSDRKNSNGLIKLIYVGRLIPEKGVQILIEALSTLDNKNSYMLEIIGDGYYRRDLEELTRKLNLEDNVCFRGLQRNIGDYLSKADVFVHPAICEEGFGIAIIEAMSAGLICMAFRKGAIPEVIENNVNGFIVDECSVNSLAQKLEEVCEHIDEMREIGINAVNRAKYFSIERLVGELHNLYETL